jgi:acyl transferase domain-containing protein
MYLGECLVSTDDSFDIAVIGMSCKFPGSNCPEEFWSHLLNGHNAIQRVSPPVSEENDNSDGFVHFAAALDNIEYFDAEFFDYNPPEAELIDPQQRLLLESSWTALEDAGVDVSVTKAIGVFVAAGTPSYLLKNLYNKLEACNTSTDLSLLLYANIQDYLASRISYKLGLTGPSQTIQTACSSALVCVHTACLNLLCQQCDVALAGGVSLRLPQHSGYAYETGFILSQDGRCCPFSGDATGTVFSGGVGTVVLKRLHDAKRDGDTIHAVIKGSAVNNDGDNKIGYTAPSLSGQVDVIEQALRIAGVEKSALQFIECHGTGTALGDEIELAALEQVFSGSASHSPCYLGAVKANIGHALAAAGIAGFIKTVLALKHNTLPANIHYRHDNPILESSESPLEMNSTVLEFDEKMGFKVAGVSSFGIGGTNAHVILQRYQQAQHHADEGVYLVPVSAKQPQALERYSQQLLNHLLDAQAPDLEAFNMADVEYTLLNGRKAFPYRKYFLFTEQATLVWESDAVTTRTEAWVACDIKLDFPNESALFSMFWFLKDVPSIRDTCDSCFTALRHTIKLDLGETFAGELKAFRVAQSQLSLFNAVVVYALLQFLKSFGVEIRVVSSGDLSLDDTLFSAQNGVQAFIEALVGQYQHDATEVVVQPEESPGGVIVCFSELNHSFPLLPPGIRARTASALAKAMLGQLWANGFSTQHVLRQEARKVSLPTYPFNGEKHWVDYQQRHSMAQPSLTDARLSLSLESQISEVWKEILGNTEITITDNFFELGGHSLNALQITGRLEDSLQIELPNSLFFEAGTISEQVLLIEKVIKDNSTAQ